MSTPRADGRRVFQGGVGICVPIESLSALEREFLREFLQEQITFFQSELQRLGPSVLVAGNEVIQ